MKSSLPLLLLLFLPGSINTYGQSNASAFSKWYVKPAVGINIPLTRFKAGETTDLLIEYNDNSFYWQLISGNYFFHRNWGLEFTFQASSYSGALDKNRLFNQEMYRQYADDYFVSPSSSGQYDRFDFFGGNVGRGYLGVVYRLEQPKFILLPRFFVGVTSFYSNWARTKLKEKGTNTILEVFHTSGEKPNDYLTLSPALTVGYRLSRRMIANLDCQYSYFKTDITFKESIRNTFTESTTVRTFDYHKNIHTLTTGIGVIFELRPVSESK